MTSRALSVAVLMAIVAMFMMALVLSHPASTSPHDQGMADDEFLYDFLSVLLDELPEFDDTADITMSDIPTDDRIVRFFVARRAMRYTLGIRFGLFAHSAIVALTDQGDHWLLEYSEDSLAHVSLIRGLVVDKVLSDHRKVRFDGYKWTLQLKGKAPMGDEWTVERAHRRMQELMPNGYSLRNREWCHTAQERLRAEMESMP